VDKHHFPNVRQAMPCARPFLGQDRQQQCGENGDDDNHHQQFNQGESGFFIYGRV
jgi:hypothetical protein